MADLFNSRDVVKMMENEVAAYADLFKLQGCCLPELVSYGRVSNGMACYLATGIVTGKTLDEADITSDALLADALKVCT